MEREREKENEKRPEEIELCSLYVFLFR